MKWGTVVALFGLAAGINGFLFFGGVPGLCLDGNRPGCAWEWAAEGAWMPLTPPKLLSPEECPYRYMYIYNCSPLRISQ